MTRQSINRDIDMVLLNCKTIPERDFEINSDLERIREAKLKIE